MTAFSLARGLLNTRVGSVLRLVGAVGLASGAFIFGYLLQFPGEMRLLLDATFYVSLMLQVSISWAAAALISYGLYLFSGSVAQNEIVTKFLYLLINNSKRSRFIKCVLSKRDLTLEVVLLKQVEQVEGHYWPIAQLFRFPIALLVFALFYFSFWEVLQLFVLLILGATMILPASMTRLLKSNLDLHIWLKEFERDISEPFRVSALLGVALVVSHFAGLSLYNTSNESLSMCIYLDNVVSRSNILGTTSSGVIMNTETRSNKILFVPYEQIDSINFPPCN